MTRVRIGEGTHKQPVKLESEKLSLEKLRTILESAHLNFLIGAGTSSPFFVALGNIEDTLTQLADVDASENEKLIIRASIQAYFFKNVLAPNSEIIRREANAGDVLMSYAKFMRTLNRILLRRRSTILSKQANIFTTNVDMLFEVAMEELGIAFSDGFSGKIRPKFDLGEFGTLQFRASSRYEHRFEIPVFNLIKIHGSAAWRQEERPDRKTEIFFDHSLSLVEEIGERLEEVDRYLCEVLDELPGSGGGAIIRPIEDLIEDARALLTRDSQENLDCEANLIEEVKSFTSKYEKLGIVNPDKRKFATTVLNETYYELIRRFSNELEKENSVLFVHGFSFRDEHLRDLVLRAARTNPTLQVVIFCYSRGGVNDYKNLLPDTEVKNGNIQFVIPEEVDEGDTERKIDLDVLESDYFAPIVLDKDFDPDQRIELELELEPSPGVRTDV